MITAEVHIYHTAGGREPFTEWLIALRDVQARARIRGRLARVPAGNLGDCKRLHAGAAGIAD